MIADDTVDPSITSEDLVGIFERLSTTHGFHAFLQMAGGPKITCRALATWAEVIVELALIPPREPWKNRYFESSHSRRRDEFLHIYTFLSLLHELVALTDWHHDHNSIRRQSSLGYRAPSKYAEPCNCSKPD